MSQSSQQPLNETANLSCNQAAINNIKVPKIDEGDVFTFLDEFEDSTSLLADSQRVRLLIRSFPSGRLRNWYISEISNLNDWSRVRDRIIKRFSYIEDRDHHLYKVKELKFDVNGSRKLYDFGDEFYYSLSKALPESSDESKIRFLKAALPDVLIPELSLNPSYNQNVNLSLILSAFRQYDKARVKKVVNSVMFKEETNDMDNRPITKAELNVMKEDIVESFKKLQLNNFEHHQAVAGIDSTQTTQNYSKPRSPSPYPLRSSNTSQRDPSPRRDPYHHDSRSTRVDQYHRSPSRQNQGSSRGDQRYYRSPSPVAQRYQQQRQPSPGRLDGRGCHQGDFRGGQDGIQQQGNNNSPAFSDSRYYQKFGIPPKPCSFCKFLHWERHCHENLN